MINPITNLTIVSVDLIDDQTRIIFSFVKPTGNIGGYYLFMSSTGAIYINVKTRVDSAHMQDLEIRGAGNLLGIQQHGFISAVGFDLYCRLLREAIANFKKAGVFNEAHN